MLLAMISSRPKRKLFNFVLPVVVHGQGISSRTNDGTYRAHKSPTVYVLGLNMSLHMVALSGAEVTLMAEPQPHVIFSHVLCYEVVKSCRKR